MRPVYLVTFCCYGSVLPGQGGSVDDDTNLYGSRYRPASIHLLRNSWSRMRDQPYLLSEPARRLVLSSILEVCAIRGWNLLAAHVRTNHAHAVLEADAIPEKVLLDFKVNSSRDGPATAALGIFGRKPKLTGPSATWFPSRAHGCRSTRLLRAHPLKSRRTSRREAENPPVSACSRARFSAASSQSCARVPVGAGMGLRVH